MRRALSNDVPAGSEHPAEFRQGATRRPACGMARGQMPDAVARPGRQLRAATGRHCNLELLSNDIRN